MIPFFVVDRPISLEILKSYWTNKPNIKYGLMTHTFTSDNFHKCFASYPCSITGYCKACLSKAHKYHIECPKRQEFRQNIIKMCDSGIFAAKRDHITYKELFDRYSEMDADYGIMVDYFLDKTKTIESATEAVNQYRKGEYNFKLVLVAQGKNLDDYLECYERLRSLGNYPIALGGLLRRKKNSARFIHLKKEDFLGDLLQKIRDRYSPEWIFTLGVFHPKRYELLSQNNVFGADYKGWIFNYQHKRDQLSREISKIEGLLTKDPVLSTLLEERQARETDLKQNKKAMQGNLRGKKKKTAKNKHSKSVSALDSCNKEILEYITKKYHGNGLPKEYKDQLKDLISLWDKSEQQVRFSGVHSYFDKELLPKITGNIQEVVNETNLPLICQGLSLPSMV